MADNTVSLWASDDVGGIQHARVKLEFGPDGTANYVSYSKPLPANIAVRGDSLAVASASVLPARVLISASSSTTTTIVNAISSARIRVIDYVVNARATTSAQFGSSTTPLTGTMIFDSKSGAAPGFNPYGHFQTSPAQPLTLINGGGAIAGHLIYIAVPYPSEVSISDTTSTHVVSTPATATAGYRLQITGEAQRRVTGAYTNISGEWLVSGSAGDFDVMATLNSGNTPTGTLGSWLNLGTQRTWELSTTSGTLTCELTISIRKTATLETLDSALVTLTAEST